MPKIKFKAGNTSLNVRGIGVIGEGDLTPGIHARLLAMNPDFANFFEIVEDEQPKPKADKVKKEPKSE